MARVTFSLDEATVARIRETAARLRRPQSQIVREAVAEYAARADCLSRSEQAQVLSVLERLKRAPVSRPAAEVDTELRAIRSSRRAGGRRTGIA